MKYSEKTAYYASKATYATFAGPVIFLLIVILKLLEVNILLLQITTSILMSGLVGYCVWHLFLSARSLYLSNIEDRKKIAELGASIGL